VSKDRDLAFSHKFVLFDWLFVFSQRSSQRMAMMTRFTLALLACITAGYSASAFVAPSKLVRLLCVGFPCSSDNFLTNHVLCSQLFVPCLHIQASSQAFSRCVDLKSQKHDDDLVVNKQALSVGALVEFTEKGRLHFGKIETSEHKSNGGARYTVMDSHGQRFSIAEKAVTYAIPPLTNERGAEQLFNELAAAQEASEETLLKKLDLSPDLLEIAWEEAASDEAEFHEVTPRSFIELIHSHAASKVEAYMAWRYLKMQHAHVFFTELKQNGRVAAFKAKNEKAVEAAKATFCSQHPEDVEFCLV
jgi:hypothetical protein